MRVVDYDIGWTAGKVTITARSDRAKSRTPEKLLLSREDALAWTKKTEADGYRFLGVEVVDPMRPRVRNGYFIVDANGQLVPAGDDWGPSEPVYEVGDALMGGPRNGKEAIIERIISGEPAKKFGFGNMFLVRERDVSSMH